jgi:aspartyl-tRNA(Asn)/glutamyl-tRNA(Gln) amidotransferase subunit A
VSRAEAASNLARFDGVKYGYRDRDAQTLPQMYSQTREEGFGFEVQSRILIGNYVLSAGHADQFYNNAKKVQAVMRQQFLDAFKEVDLLFAPGSSGPAFKFGADGSPGLFYRSDEFNRYSCLTNSMWLCFWKLASWIPACRT